MTKRSRPAGPRRPTGVFLQAFRGRNSSGASNLSFLWRSDRLYVMDNHRAAMWCWWQHLDEAEVWDLLHIDRHFDSASAEPEMPYVPAVTAPLAAYLSAEFPWAGKQSPVVRWDNYLWLFLERHREKVRRAVCAAPSYQGAAMPPQHPGYELIDPWSLLRHFEMIAEEAASVREGDARADPPWIVNIDLDYFTNRFLRGDNYVTVFSDAYVSAIGHGLAEGLRTGVIGVATIALSPETTGGNNLAKSWAVAERMLGMLLREWGETPDLGHVEAKSHPRVPGRIKSAASGRRRGVGK